jgi:ankyrin repeat protein
LFVACSQGKYMIENRNKIVEMLLAKGADAEIRDNRGRSPFDVARSKHRTFIRKILAKHVASQGGASESQH